MMASKKGNRANNHQNTSGSRGEDRKKHFADGGSLAEWRGTHTVHKNKKDKRQNRRTRRQQAIRDSIDDS
jgi:hypothetical protein